MIVPAYHIVPLKEEQCQEICTWSYPPPYDIYNWRPWADMLAAQEEFADKELREQQYRAVVDNKGEMWGFAQFFPMKGVTRLGLGMDPKRCGQGFGVDFVRAVAAYAREQSPDNEIDLEVLTWNIRAYRVYRSAGFVHTDSYDRMTPHGRQAFYCMVRKHAPDE
ncbi:GNAT family N-acetyltransferase [Paenibacillus xerothermodurans]|uniref:GNAT family N-acetyltransferase n=1 Tax=Paenibacillus xerothermodurans TaxID=1977292 RepID=A0A2W1NZ43_PAEXE|nr:GNAT family protein [Paenibacillus xerothermodurans]PZE20118.1 GNAT family N-acetyltransferase [Paenibacillus xerothermodurans]